MGKKLLLLGLVFVLVGVWTPNVFAFGYIGRPTAELNKGQWSAGFNYSYSTQDLDTTKLKWDEYYSESWTEVRDVDGVVVDADSEEEMDSGSLKMKSRDFNTQRYVGRLAYGVSDSWTVYGQLGGADVEGKWRGSHIEPGDPEDEEDGAPVQVSDGLSMNFDNDFTWGLGTKITFARQPKTEWGVAIQMNWLNTSWSEKVSTTSYYEDSWVDSEVERDSIDLESYDIVIAVGPTVDMGGWRLYGGPFYYYLSGDIERKYETSEVDTGPTGAGYTGTYSEVNKGTASADLDAQSNFGGYIGAQFDISKTCNATLEFAATGDGWGMGAGLTFLCK
jgi:hypothetical protein